MPLRVHFRPPLSERRSWKEVHGGWPMVIVQHLAQILPPRFTAGPRVHWGAQVEIDVAAYDEDSGGELPRESDAPSVATAVWTPSEPTFAVETALSDFDVYEVRIHDTRHHRRLVASIELISPSNKDRPESRSQFTSKCAALLRTGVSVILVDAVTVSEFNLYAELLRLVEESDASLADPPPATYVVACRWAPYNGGQWLETWSHVLSLGECLPLVPLWLSDECAIPLELEASYEQTCRDIRIP